jgi:hypothetical protein
MTREYEVWESGAGSLLPKLAYVAYDDTCAHGATPEEAIENLREMLED